VEAAVKVIVRGSFILGVLALMLWGMACSAT